MQDVARKVADESVTKPEMDKLIKYARTMYDSGHIKTAQEFQDYLQVENSTVREAFERVQQEQTDAYVEKQKKGTQAPIKQTIKVTTEGGTDGTITQTTRQALKKQFADFNRGIKEGLKQAREQTKEKAQLVKDTRTNLKKVIREFPKSLDGKTVPKGVTSRLLVELNRAADNIDKLEDFADTLERTADDLNYLTKVDNAKTLVDKVKKLAKSKEMPFDLRNLLKRVGNINTKFVQDIEAFSIALDEILKFRISPTMAISAKDGTPLAKNLQQSEQAKELNRLLNELRKQETAYLQARADKLSEKLKAKGIDPTTIQTLHGTNYEAMVAALEEVLAGTKVSRVQQMRDAGITYQAMVYLNVDTSGMTEQAKSDIATLSKLDFELLPEAKLPLVVAGFANLVNNNSLAGLGQAITQSKIQTNLANTTLMSNIRANIRQAGARMAKIQKAFGSGSVRIAALTKDMMNVGYLNSVMGLTDLKIATQKVVVYRENLVKEENELIKKFKKDLANPVNNMLLGIYRDIVNTEEGWTQEQIDAEPALRLTAFVKSLELLKEKAKLDVGFAKDYKEYIANYETAINKIAVVKRTSTGELEAVTLKMTPQQLYNSLPAGQRAYSTMATRRYAENEAGLIYNSEVMNNIDLGNKIVNYSPRMYTKLVTGKDVDFGVLAKSITEGGQTSTKGQVSGSGKSRLLSGSELPSNLALDPSFVERFKGEITKAVYDVETQRHRMYAYEATNETSSPFIKELENAIPVQTYKEIMLNKINNDLLTLGGSQIKLEAWKRLAGYLSKTGTAIGLGALGQYLKQIPPVVDVALRTQSQPKAMLLAIKYLNSGGTDIEELLKIANVKGRDAIKLLKIPSTTRDRKIDTKELAGLLKQIGLTAEEVSSVLADFSLKPLQMSDKYVADLGWLTFYMHHQLEHGNSINLDPKNLDRLAYDYADTQTSAVMNESDNAMQAQGKLINSNYVKYTMPFIRFAINSKLNLITDISKLGDKGNTKRAQSIKALSGNLIATATFMGLSAGIRYLAGGAAIGFMSAVIFGTADVDDEEKEELLQMISKSQKNEARKKQIREIGYLSTEFLTGGIAGNLTEPLIRPLNNQFARWGGYTEAEIKEANQKPNSERVFEMIGTAGITIKTAVDAYHSFENVFQSNEDFIEQHYGEFDPITGKLVVNPYRLDPQNIESFARPHFSKKIQIASALIEATSLTGLSLQEVNTFKRNLQKYDRMAVEKLRGKATTQNLKGMVETYNDVKEIEVADEKIALTPEQVLKTLEYRDEFISILTKKYPFIEQKLSREEYAKFLRTEATKVAKDRIGYDIFIGGGTRTPTEAMKKARAKDVKKQVQIEYENK